MPKTCPQCQRIHGGFAVKCECGFDLTEVAASGPLFSTPTPTSTGTIKIPVGQLIGLVGCVLAAFGGLLPLSSTSVPHRELESGSSVVRNYDHNWFAMPGLGNAVLGLAVGGAVLLVVGHPSGATAVGAGLVAFVIPVPSQVVAGEFGWLSWCVVILGGVLLISGGVSELRRRVREDRLVTDKPASPIAASAPDGSTGPPGR
jgi:hypothetical protein